MNKKYKEYIDDIYEFIDLVNTQRNKLKNPDYFNISTVEELQRDNELLYGDILIEKYDLSFVNPSYAVKIYGEEGRLLSCIIYEIRKVIPYIFRNDEESVESYLTFSKDVIFQLEKNNYEGLIDLYKEFMLNELNRDTIEEVYGCNFLDNTVKLSYIDEKYIFRYGFYVKESEFMTSKYMRKWNPEKIKKSGETIAKAYDKGFIYSNKDKEDRRITKVQFHLGQEPLALRVMESLSSIGYIPKVTNIFPIGANPQCDYDHKDDIALVLDKKYVERFKISKEKIYDKNLNTLTGVAGFTRLLQFGKIEDTPKPKEEGTRLNSKQKELVKEIFVIERTIGDKYMPKSKMSYTGAAYPNWEIDKLRYEEILEAIVEINNMDSSLWEKIQDIIINELDKADNVKIKGRNGNKTDLIINIHGIEDYNTQTAFKNTGADVNLPLGEVFTSPVLKGTSGILHVSETYREAFRYENLILEFKDGMVVDYNCNNFKLEGENGEITSDVSKNRDYIESTLLYPHKTLPMGEFAIGTNTYAYVMSKKLDIVDKLPGIIVEKMGPHFAIGDTCFAYGEDVKVVNVNTKKEMIAKENEISKNRKENPNKAYFNTHTDITLPYEEIEYIKVVKKDKNEVDIIRNGRFVLEGTEVLNKYFD